MYLYLLFFFACLGSFCSAYIYRFIHQEDIVFDRSHCPHCHHSLAWWQLIPLFSWLFLRGNCYYCKKPISLFYPINECLHVLLFCFLYYYFKNPIDILLWGIYISICYMLSYIDYQTQLVPIPLLIALTCICICLCPITFYTLLLMTSIFIVLCLLYMLFKNQLGFADIVFIAIHAIVLPLSSLSMAITIACILALFYIITKKRNQLQQPIPFFPFLTLGFFIMLFIHYF